jgi:hypothetical protein
VGNDVAYEVVSIGVWHLGWHLRVNRNAFFPKLEKYIREGLEKNWNIAFRLNFEHSLSYLCIPNIWSGLSVFNIGRSVSLTDLNKSENYIH